MVKLVDIKPMESYRLWLKYEDGVEGVIDFSKEIGKGVFSHWNNPKNFEAVKIGEDGEISWNDKIDICADAMYLKITGKQPQDVFPSLKGRKAVA